MNIRMSYMDYSTADLEDRELFSRAVSDTSAIYKEVMEVPGVLGTVLIATCNRTEMYLSLAEDVDLNPFVILCRCAGLDPLDYAHMYKSLAGEDVLRHLCKLTAGAESQLWGDSQIITQVRDSFRDANKNHATDTYLNVCFRISITCGKKIRDKVSMRINDSSTADRAVAEVKNSPEIQRVLVIGNGIIGKLIAKELVSNGIKTYMTLRRYKHAQVEVPSGVETISYAERYDYMGICQAVISATSSPHHVVKAEEVKRLINPPKLFVDMAVPRDIEPKVSEIKGIVCKNIDDISGGRDKELINKQMAIIEGFVDEYIDEFYHWNEYREQMEKKIYILGMDKTLKSGITARRAEILRKCDIVLGYKEDLDIIRNNYRDYQVQEKAMESDIDLPNMAIYYGSRGKKVALICGDDDAVTKNTEELYKIATTRLDIDIITASEAEVVANEEQYYRQEHFPLFISSNKKNVLVLGGGPIAERRIRTLSKFLFNITVVSPELSGELREMVDDGRITYIEDKYDPKYLEGINLVATCTNNREVNHSIAEACYSLGKPVSVCDSQEESTWWFPAIAVNDELSMGLVGTGRSHGLVRRAAARLRDIIERKAY